MKCRLYPNMQRLTTLFILGIVCATLAILTLRLTVFSDMVSIAPPKDTTYVVSEKGCQINTKIYFPTAGSKGDILIFNAEDNEYVIKVNLMLADTRETIYSTKLLNPNESVETTRLNAAGQELETGVYQCIAEVTTHNLSNLKPEGSTQVPVEIYIGQKPEALKSDK